MAWQAVPWLMASLFMAVAGLGLEKSSNLDDDVPTDTLDYAVSIGPEGEVEEWKTLDSWRCLF